MHIAEQFRRDMVSDHAAFNNYMLWLVMLVEAVQFFKPLLIAMCGHLGALDHAKVNRAEAVPPDTE